MRCTFSTRICPGSTRSDDATRKVSGCWYYRPICFAPANTRATARSPRHGAFYTRFLKIIRKNAGFFRRLSSSSDSWRVSSWKEKKSKTVSGTFRIVCHNAKLVQSKKRKCIFSENTFICDSAVLKYCYTLKSLV